MQKKITFTFFSFIFLFLLVLLKAFYTQVINKEKLIAYAESQFLRTVKVYPKRGNILDRNGKPLAINIQSYHIFTIPKKGMASTYKKLSKIVPQLNYQDLLKRVRGRKRYTWLARGLQLKNKQVEEIEKLDEIYIEPMPSRLYPNHEILSHVLGFVGIDNNGLSGIEYAMDERLRGEAQIIKYYKDAKGRPIRYETNSTSLEVKDLYLSIDKEIQAMVESFLRKGVLKHKADRGGAAVIDVETGELWAIANYPTYDPNEYGKYRQSNRKLSFISDPFEPGSTFKTITVASALEHKIVNPDTNYYCEGGRMRVGDHIISEAAHSEKFEWLSVKDILKYSSNVGVTKIAFDLGYEKLRSTTKKLGFGAKTGIELPGESRGILTQEQRVKPLALSNISFGQGIAVTALQMLQAYLPFANGGYFIKPTILKKQGAEEIERKRVFSENIVLQVQEMLHQVVVEGTGKNAQVQHFQIAGKTSTAQKPSKEGGYKGYISSFIGYPMGIEKRFLVFVYVDNPRENGYYGNEVAAPIFREITEYILLKKREFNNLSFYKNHQTQDHVSIKQSAIKRLSRGEVPSFIGLDKVSSQKLAKKASLNIEMKGFGIVFDQKPRSGESLSSTDTIQLYFEPPRYE